MANGQHKGVEDELRTCFKKEIDATSMDESADVKEGVAYNSKKQVFQASVNIGEHFVVKEFKVKADVEHWIDLLKSLEGKKLLKSNIALMKMADATRQATEAAYEKIIQAKQTFTPESEPTLKHSHQGGKDIWATLFPKYKETPESTLCSPQVRVPQTSLEKLKVMGFSNPVVGEIFGWHHNSLWRGINIITHDGNGDIDNIGIGSDLVHIGFIRCSGEDAEPTEKDKQKMRHLLQGTNVVACIIVTYPAPCTQKVTPLSILVLKEASSIQCKRRKQRQPKQEKDFICGNPGRRPFFTGIYIYVLYIDTAYIHKYTTHNYTYKA